MKTGYLVEYSEKKGVFDATRNVERFICSNKILSELLQNRHEGMVWNANWINVEEYLMNNDAGIKIYV